MDTDRLNFKRYVDNAEAFEKEAGEKLAEELSAYAKQVSRLLIRNALHAAHQAIAELATHTVLDEDDMERAFTQVFLTAATQTLMRSEELLAQLGGPEKAKRLIDLATETEKRVQTKKKAERDAGLQA